MWMRLVASSRAWLKGFRSSTDYFESPKPESEISLCQRRNCNNHDPRPLVPGVSGFLYIDAAVVLMRDDARKLPELQAKLDHLVSYYGTQELDADENAFPIVVCESCVKEMELDMDVARSDAQYLMETGRVPLRPTPRRRMA